MSHTCELNGANPFDYLTELPEMPGNSASNRQIRPRFWPVTKISENPSCCLYARVPREMANHFSASPRNGQIQPTWCGEVSHANNAAGLNCGYRQLNISSRVYSFCSSLQRISQLFRERINDRGTGRRSAMAQCSEDQHQFPACCFSGQGYLVRATRVPGFSLPDSS